MLLQDLLDLRAPPRGCAPPRRPRAAARCTKKAPWSSCGRKPVGVMRDSAEDADADQPPISSSDSTRHAHQPLHDPRHSRRAPSRCRAARSPIGAAPSGRAWRRNTAHSAGDSVSAFIAEISMATLIVTANWRNSSPEMPGMKADRHEDRQQHQA